jgi:predicted nucleic acid-binding protein
LIAVLDASAAVRTVMVPATPFREALSTADLVVAPELIVAEVCSAFRKYVRAGVLSRRAADRSIGQALALVDTMQPMRELVPEVLALSARTGSSVYDLFYLALAQRTGATLFTADNAFRRAAAGAGVKTFPL